MRVIVFQNVWRNMAPIQSSFREPKYFLCHKLTDLLIRNHHLKNVLKIEKVVQYQKRNLVKVSKKDKKLLEEGPLVSCNKKKYGWQELVDNVVAQDRLRTNFVELLESSESTDIVMLPILTYIIVKSVKKFRKFYAYEVPSLDDTGKKTGSFSLCQKNLCYLFNFYLTKLKTTQKLKKDPNKCVTVQIKKRHRRKQQFCRFA